MNIAFIINADDLGYDAAVNDAIFDLFRRGLCSSATLMANMEGFDDAVSKILEGGLAGRIGVHLNLTEGVPLTDGIRKNGDLTNGDGVFALKKERLAFSSESRRLAYAELCAQVDRCRKAGLAVRFADSHHHIHEYPSLSRVFLEVVRQKEIGCLRKAQNLASNSRILKKIYRRYLNGVIERNRLGGTDYFADIHSFDKIVDPEVLNGSSIELMVHPGRVDGSHVYDTYDGVRLDEALPKTLRHGRLVYRSLERGSARS